MAEQSLMGSSLSAITVVHTAGSGKPGGRTLPYAREADPEYKEGPHRSRAIPRQRPMMVGALSPGDRFVTKLQGKEGVVLAKGRADISEPEVIETKSPPSRKFPMGLWDKIERPGPREVVPIVLVEIAGQRMEVHPNLLVIPR